jgi:hypothetical protein
MTLSLFLKGFTQKLAKANIHKIAFKKGFTQKLAKANIHKIAFKKNTYILIYF